MAEPQEVDLKAAINAVSDVIQNRPRPLREFDQIYMKAGDMVMQSELIARWTDKKRVAFIGDGDAISVCVAYLHKRGIVPYGPSRIVVFDFDERICNAVKRFADKERLDQLDSQLSLTKRVRIVRDRNTLQLCEYVSCGHICLSWFLRTRRLCWMF